MEKTAHDRGEEDYVCFLSFRPKDQTVKIFYSAKWLGNHEDVFRDNFEEKLDKASNDKDWDGRWMDKGGKDDAKGKGKKGKEETKGWGRGKGKFSKTDLGSKYPFRPRYERVDDQDDPKGAWKTAYDDHLFAIENPNNRILTNKEQDSRQPYSR